MNYEYLGKQIRRIRKAKDLTQAQLAEQADISPNHLSHIECGTTKASLAVFSRIALALDVSADQLLFGTLPGKAPIYAQEIETILGDCTPKTQAAVMEMVRTFGAALTGAAKYETEDE